MIKSEELRDSLSCLNRAGNDEPIFVLRAKDPVAAQTVRLWASMAAGIHDEKIEDALLAADNMEVWRVDNMPTPAEPKGKRGRK
jgi:hypothetical protein